MNTQATAKAGRARVTARPRLADSINEACPWSGNPIRADSLTLYRGAVVGFCNPGCRDKFETAVQLFDTRIAKLGSGRTGKHAASRAKPRVGGK